VTERAIRGTCGAMCNVASILATVRDKGIGDWSRTWASPSKATKHATARYNAIARRPAALLSHRVVAMYLPCPHSPPHVAGSSGAAARPADAQFVNPPRLQSVPGFSHFHVFARRKTPEEIDASEAAYGARVVAGAGSAAS
jgi:hypothetical protein